MDYVHRTLCSLGANRFSAFQTIRGAEELSVVEKLQMHRAIDSLPANSVRFWTQSIFFGLGKRWTPSLSQSV